MSGRRNIVLVKVDTSIYSRRFLITLNRAVGCVPQKHRGALVHTGGPAGPKTAVYGSMAFDRGFEVLQEIIAEHKRSSVTRGP
jgi:hypothetical protein